MKTISKILGIVFAASLVLSQTSCVDDDEKTGSILSGEWFGDFGMCYDYTYRTHRGDTITETFISTDTHIIFYPKKGSKYADSGYGYQYDYYRYGPYEYKYYYFDWRVDNGIISLNYPVDDELSTQILDYRMDENIGIFIGRLAGSNTKFTLRKVAEYSNWEDLNTIIRNNWLPSYGVESSTQEIDDAVVKPWNKFVTPRE